MRNCFLTLGLCCVTVSAAGAGQAFSTFGGRPTHTLEVAAFSDDQIETLLDHLDRLLVDDTEALWHVARRLQQGRLSAAQETRVLAHLDGLAARLPGGRRLVEGPRRIIADLRVGRPAPEIVGTDLGGQSLRLSDFRGRVVVLSFTAEWCAICRSQIPYHQFLGSRFDGWPLVQLEVQTGADRAVALGEQQRQLVPDRAWWDEPEAGSSSGPIATAWNVRGLPAIYLIDGEGIIRFVDVRDEDLLKAVRQLVDAQLALDLRAGRQPGR